MVLREMRLPYRILELILLMMLAAVPSLFLNLPVGLLARLYANHRRKKALAESRVKVKGMDVMLSEKVLICIVLVPTLWLFYGILLILCTNLDGPAIALILWSLPLFSYMGYVNACSWIFVFISLRALSHDMIVLLRQRRAW
jgi:glycerol-3-phosphate O-acyltransferase/dihydroxyacetone phosphate acyltransferase